MTTTQGNHSFKFAVVATLIAAAFSGAAQAGIEIGDPGAPASPPSATVPGGIAIGVNATSNAGGFFGGGIAIGQNAASSNESIVAIGQNAGFGYTGSFFDTFIGPNAGAQFNGPRVYPYGQYAASTMIGAMAGVNADPGAQNTFLGYNAGANSRNGPVVAFGYGSPQAGQNVALGPFALADSTGNFNVGVGAVGGSVFGSNNTYVAGMSAGNNTRGNDNIGLGALAGAGNVGSRNIALGSNQGNSDTVHVDAGDVAAYATGGNVRGDDNIALGTGAGTGITASSTIAIGTGAIASGSQSISIGTGNVVGGANSGAFGDPSRVSGNSSYSIGNNNTVGQDNTFVVGNNVTTTQANAVVLGNGSADRAAAQITSAAVQGATYGGFAGTAAGVASVGAAGAERQIINVAPGAITAGSTDAVNGSQVYSVATGLDNKITNVANGVVNNQSGVRYDINADGTTNYQSVTLGGQTATSATALHNVAAGAVGTDAVNVNQLNATSTAIGARIDNLQQQVQDNRTEARRGAASAMAMSDAPMPSAPGKTSWSANTAFYKGEAALGASLAHRLKTDMPMAVNVGISAAAGAVGIRVGLKGEF